MELKLESKHTEQLDRLIYARVRTLESGKRVAPHVIRVKVPWAVAALAPERAMRNLKRDVHVEVIEFIEAYRLGYLGKVEVHVERLAFIDDLMFDVSFGRFEKDFQVYEALKNRLRERQCRRRIAEGALIPSLNVVAEITHGSLERRSLLLQFNADKPRLCVGRAANSDLRFEDNSVDLVHAVLSLNYLGQLFVSDANSACGTFIENAKLYYGEVKEIKKGDEVQFGNVVVQFSKQHS